MFSYFGIALIAWAFEGSLCYSQKKRFKVFASFICCLCWPIVAPIAVYHCAIETKDHPDW